MIVRSILVATAFTALGAIPTPTAAQDAAETATILAGQGGTARAQRSLGSAISGSINGGAAAIRTTGTARRQTTNRRTSRNARRGGDSGSITLTTNDPLEGTDAATYQTGNGTTIRVSGRMNPSASTACVNHCPTEKPKS